MAAGIGAFIRGIVRRSVGGAVSLHQSLPFLNVRCGALALSSFLIPPFMTVLNFFSMIQVRPRSCLNPKELTTKQDIRLFKRAMEPITDIVCKNGGIGSKVGSYGGCSNFPFFPFLPFFPLSLGRPIIPIHVTM